MPKPASTSLSIVLAAQSSHTTAIAHFCPAGDPHHKVAAAAMAALQAWQLQQPAMLEPFLDRLVPALCMRLTDAKEGLRSTAERWVIDRLTSSHQAGACKGMWPVCAVGESHQVLLRNPAVSSACASCLGRVSIGGPVTPRRACAARPGIFSCACRDCADVAQLRHRMYI